MCPTRKSRLSWVLIEDDLMIANVLLLMRCRAQNVPIAVKGLCQYPNFQSSVSQLGKFNSAHSISSKEYILFQPYGSSHYQLPFFVCLDIPADGNCSWVGGLKVCHHHSRTNPTVRLRTTVWNARAAGADETNRGVNIDHATRRRTRWLVSEAHDSAATIVVKESLGHSDEFSGGDAGGGAEGF